MVVGQRLARERPDGGRSQAAVEHEARERLGAHEGHGGARYNGAVGQ